MAVNNHPCPFQLEWIKKKLPSICVVPLSIRKSYSDHIAYDVVDMDVAIFILSRPWQFEEEAVYRGKLNQYVIQVGDN